MSEPETGLPAEATITIGIRRYHAATGEITTVREPQEFRGRAPSMFRDQYPLCECPRCRER